jgi:hypothetical protein
VNEPVQQTAKEAGGNQQAAAQRSAMLAMWRGDVGGAIRTILAADALTADFVSIAAAAGTRCVCRLQAMCYIAGLFHICWYSTTRRASDNVTWC